MNGSSWILTMLPQWSVVQETIKFWPRAVKCGQRYNLDTVYLFPCACTRLGIFSSLLLLNGQIYLLLYLLSVYVIFSPVRALLPDQFIVFCWFIKVRDNFLFAFSRACNVYTQGRGYKRNFTNKKILNRVKSVCVLWYRGASCSSIFLEYQHSVHWLWANSDIEKFSVFPSMLRHFTVSSLSGGFPVKVWVWWQETETIWGNIFQT